MSLIKFHEKLNLGSSNAKIASNEKNPCLLLTASPLQSLCFLRGQSTKNLDHFPRGVLKAVS